MAAHYKDVAGCVRWQSRRPPHMLPGASLRIKRGVACPRLLSTRRRRYATAALRLPPLPSPPPLCNREQSVKPTDVPTSMADATDQTTNALADGTYCDLAYVNWEWHKRVQYGSAKNGDARLYMHQTGRSDFVRTRRRNRVETWRPERTITVAERYAPLSTVGPY
jgi:hypothetical protein